jgi:glycine cleavage system H protein
VVDPATILVVAMKHAAPSFPERLLYSRDYLWVERMAEDRVRLGLHFLALSHGRGGVYFVKLPPAGAAVERGRPFGFVDLAGSTLALRAPVSGRVAALNEAVRDDAGLVGRDPFAAGWLCEVDRVPLADVRALLDRERAVRYYGLVSETRGRPLAVSQRLARDRAWASELRVRLGDDIVVRGRLLPAGANEAFTPDWGVGDGWRVVLRYRRPSYGASESGVEDVVVERTFEYAVLQDALLGPDECWRLAVAEVQEEPPETLKVLYFRTADFTLAAVDDIPTHDVSAFSRRPNAWGNEPFVQLGPADLLIVDHPRMPCGCADDTRHVRVAGEPALTQLVRFRAGATRMEVELVAEELGERLVSRQVWERGLPWWTEAVRERGGVEVVRAALVLDPGVGDDRPDEVTDGASSRKEAWP